MIVHYVGFNQASNFRTPKTMITPEGSLAVRLLNKTGAPSIKGTIVETSSTTDDAFETSAADCVDPVGVVYEDGIADGSYCWVVVSGKVQVLLENSTAATRNYWVRTSVTAGGRADATNASPPGGTVGALENHLKELGHCLESVGSGTDVLCWIMLHFN